MRIRNTIPLAALGACLALPAAANAINVREARFAAEVKAHATTTWSLNRTDVPDSPCGARFTGHGTERFEFATRNPIRMTARSYNGSDPMVTFGPTGRAFGIPVAGKVRRNGTSNATQNDPKAICGRGGDGDPLLTPLVQPDCGTKPFSMTVRMNYIRGRVSLFPGSSTTRYKSCPASGVAFPSFVTSKGGPTRILSAGLSKREVFDRTEGKYVLLGYGSQRSNVLGTNYLSTIHWTITLTRVD